MEEGRGDQMKLLLQAVEEVTDKVEQKVMEEPPPVVMEDRPEDLEGCEKLIEGSSLKNNFLSIGQALVTINDRKLYKDSGYTSFTQYIEQKGDFGFGPRQALRLLAATRLVRNFPPNIALPSSERQVRLRERGAAQTGVLPAASRPWVASEVLAHNGSPSAACEWMSSNSR